MLSHDRHLAYPIFGSAMQCPCVHLKVGYDYPIMAMSSDYMPMTRVRVKS